MSTSVDQLGLMRGRLRLTTSYTTRRDLTVPARKRSGTLPSVQIQRLPGELAIARLPPAEPTPDWAHGTALFVSVSRSTDELSIVCPTDWVPDDVACSPGWVALKVMGQINLSVVGVLASLADILRDAHVSIFAVSTYDTDYLLVPHADADRSVQALIGAGHDVLDWA